MKAPFQPGAEDKDSREPLLVDPEAYDPSELEFAASVEETTSRCAVQVKDGDGNRDNQLPDQSSADLSSQNRSTQDPESWRQEVTARLTNYRTRRRPREPRYPSLRLKFESGEPAWTAPVPNSANGRPAAQPVTRSSAAFEAAAAEPAPVEIAAEHVLFPTALESPVETTARIIPFPRSAVAPPLPLEELAGPVPDRPRILEVPEVAPPPPALGGILIESAEEPVRDKRPGFEIPLQSSRLAPRVVAAALDGALVLIALALSSWIFFRLTAVVPPLRSLASIAIGALGIFWVGYQYLLLVYTGTTPGLKLAHLRLNRFDGGATPRHVRRWRVLASALSAVSLGLGYAWCLLDEDQLCWHDRITRTYLAPATPANNPETETA